MRLAIWLPVMVTTCLSRHLHVIFMELTQAHFQSPRLVRLSRHGRWNRAGAARPQPPGDTREAPGGRRGVTNANRDDGEGGKRRTAGKDAGRTRRRLRPDERERLIVAEAVRFFS